MNIAPHVPILRYPGSKWRLAPWIHSFIPEHDSYCEPFVGSASVLLRKPRSRMETVNDASGDLINFLITLREHPDELVRLIECTYYSKREWEMALQPAGNPLERARRFYVRCYMSIRPFDTTASFRRQKVLSRSKSGDSPMTPASRQFVRVEHLRSAANRLRGVCIEQLDALEFIQLYDYESACFYIDPPYPFDTRARKLPVYPVDEMANSDHVLLAQTLHGIKGMAIVSGYACPLYTELYEDNGWHRVDKEARIDGGGTAVESLWLSPRTWEAKQEERKRAHMEREAAALPLFAHSGVS